MVSELQGDPDVTRILITGASGFLGRRIVARCREIGLIVRSTGRSRENVAELDDYRAADLSDVQQVQPLLDRVDVVIHAAGLAHQFRRRDSSAAEFERCNVQATANLMNAAAAAQVKHVVLVSSVAVYGASGGAFCDEKTTCRPASPYAQSKLRAEQQAIEIAREFSTRLTILRPATLYGEGDPGNVGRLMRLIERRRFVWIGRGTNRKSLVHVDDAAAACVRAAVTKSGASVSVYNIAGKPLPMRDIVHATADALGKPTPQWFMPAALCKAAVWAASACTGRRGRVARIKSSITTWLKDDAYDGGKFQRDFGFEPVVELVDGIARQVAASRGTAPLRIYSQGRKSGVLKRAMDVFVSAASLMVLALPLLLVAAAVKWSSPGPVLYWSDRVGRGNKLFRMPKFRSMRTDTPQLATHLLTGADQWITPIGRLLRATSIDELPQLWSVLVGDMSLVGPRPALFNQHDLIELRTDAGVHELSPGITGWAQVNGRDELPIPVKVQFDAEYLDTQSLLTDLKIIALTLVKVVRREGVVQAGGQRPATSEEQPLRRPA